MKTQNHLLHYAHLMRLHKPKPVLLLLWPTLWALWLAAGGFPNATLLLIFVTGVLLMRSAGCVANDLADRHVDGHVSRTRERPLAAKKIRVQEALILLAILLIAAFLLVCLCNRLTIALAFVGAALALIYPFLKRITHLPQLGLGLAFSWGIPMAFAATQGTVPASAWFLFVTGLIWPVIYDTQYAMADRADDIKIGVKSTAILFKHWDCRIIAILQTVFVLLLIVLGWVFALSGIYYFCLPIVAGLFFYQQRLMKDRDEQKCFQAFLNNNWVGLVIFMGIMLGYLQ